MSDKVIELIKWIISSVCIVIVTIIIDTGFKEREAGIKEMEVYDKYVNIILQADNIEQRWKLCEYFSIVTPTERLRTRWQAYKDTISTDYFNWKKSKIVDSIDVGLLEKPLINNSQDSEKAQSFEINGFEYLLNKDVDDAITNFKEAEDSKHGYHNCYEILNYLKNNKSELLNKDSNLWNDLYNKLIINWSWGMTSDVKDRIKSKIK